MSRLGTWMLALVLLLISAQPANATGNGPWIIVTHWDYSGGCISGLEGQDWLENVTSDTLVLEWYGTDPGEALKAGATIIREDGNYFHFTGIDYSASLFCVGVTPFSYDFRDSRMYYVPGGLGRHTTTSNAAVSETNGIGWTDWGNYVYLEFLSCTQNQTVTLANGNWPWFQIVGDSTGGVYAPGVACGGVGSHTGLATNTLY
jgi:hypothetical protein